MKPLKTLIILMPFAMITLKGCTSELNGPTIDEKVQDISSIDDFVKIAKELEANMPEDVLNSRIIPKSYSFNAESEKIAEILEPLKKVGLNVNNEFINDTNLSKMELENLSKLTDQELVLAGILYIVMNEREQIMNTNYKSSNSDIIQGITGDQLIGCLVDAFGLASAIELIAGNAALNADTILLAARKLGARTLGWIGVAVISIELATCLAEKE